jgi:hypothetical protein
MTEKEKIKERINSVLPLLNESQKRQYLGAEARSMGWGGISKVSKLTGVNRASIKCGIDEIEGVKEKAGDGRIRKSGGGRKSHTYHYPELDSDIKSIVEAHTMGDPERLLLWVSKSIRHVSKALETLGYKVSHETVRQRLKNMGYSLQSNKKTLEGGTHPDRDAQFEFINDKAKSFISESLPVISVDCKKKELIGNYKNNGKEWTAVKTPQEVNVYDFVDMTNGKAAPYGVYDIANNKGWVSVGIGSDTAAFAVNSIKSWWEQEGIILYPESKKLYINADGGGSNSSRSKLWKEELQRFADQSGLEIHVSHYPPGTSKWNKIEHRLFSFISKNWRAKPLESLAIIISLIGATTTQTGLKVTARLDENKYETGIVITDEQMKEWNIKKHEFHGEWNYIINPNLKE